MQDRPTAQELAEAVREFLEREILPGLGDGRRRFRALVAMNALSIVARELALEGAPLREEASGLARLLKDERALPEDHAELRRRIRDLNAQLARLIRQGAAPDGALEHLRSAVAGKLRIASPRYLERYRA